MTSQRRHTSPITAHDAADQQLPATTSHARSIDVTVAEWTVDLGVFVVGPHAPSTSSVVAARYVDFDAVESVHRATTTATVRR